MQEKLLDILRCPVTRSRLTLKIIKKGGKLLDERQVVDIEEGILFAEKNWFYPIIRGIPRLCVESPLEHAAFLKLHLPDYEIKKENLLQQYGSLLKSVQKKNKRTRASFTREWKVYDYEKDKTWDAGDEAMLARFLQESDENISSLSQKLIFDAGCGNGRLNELLGRNGIHNIAMDFSDSLEVAEQFRRSAQVHFIQGDVQFPPVAFDCFDIVHSSGVLIHTNNTELSFSCLAPLVKVGGKFSIWVYHRRKDLLHRIFNRTRNVTSRLPPRLQYFFYATTLFPASFVIKKLKGNPQNAREMMVDILDWFTPEFRWEHDQDEVTTWFCKRKFESVKTTTTGVFGFNMVGRRV